VRIGQTNQLSLIRNKVYIIKPRCSPSAAAYNRQTFSWTICRSYGRASVGLSSALWQNGGSDPVAVWHYRSDGSRDEAGSGVWGSVYGKGYFVFGANLERAIVTNGGFTAYVHVRQHHDAALFPNYFGQTCYVSS